MTNISHEPMPSFADAQRHASDGYLSPALLAELTSSWFYIGDPRLTDLPDFFGPFFAAIAVAHLAHPGRPLRVIDFGGTIGRYRDYADTMFSGAIKFDWTVVETPLYVNHGRSLGLPVTFAESMDGLTADLVIFSGVLQYLPDWKAVLGHPAVRSAGHIFVTRTPLGDEEKPFLQTVEYQSGTVKLAARVIARADLNAVMGGSHELAASWSLQPHVGPFGAVDAPSMLWRLSR